MSDDGFVFDDSDEHDTDDETELFGTRSDESHDDTTEIDRRFGTPTTDDTDSPLTERVPEAGGTVRTVAMVALAFVFVIAVGLVAYPLVMGALDAPDSPDGGETTTEGSGGFADPTDSSTTAPATGTIVEEPAGTTAVTTVETTPPRTTVATAPTARPPSSTPTSTPTATPTPTPLPTRGFPAGDPANETNESA